MSRAPACAVLLATLLASRLGSAHGGEDHGAPAPPPAPAPAGSGERAVWAQTASFELGLKFGPHEPGVPLELRVFLADWATNVPVEDASISLDFSGPAAVTVAAEPTASPGIYQAEAAFPQPGAYELLAIVTAGDAVDLLTISGVEIGPAPPVVSTTPAAEPHGPPLWVLVAAGFGLFVIALVIGVSVGRHSVRRSAPALFLLALVPAEAWPHGGESHGDEPAAAPRPSLFEAVFLAKESQFLLGVQTEVVSERDIIDRILAFGHVNAPTDRWAELHSPQPGRVTVPPDGSLPIVGDRVTRGQILAVIEASLSTTEQTDIESRRNESRTRVSQTRAQLEQAERELERLQSLEGVVAARELQAAQLAVDLAREEYRRTQRERDLLTPSSDPDQGQFQFPIESPVDGVVAEVHIAVGEQIDPSHLLLTVFDPTEVWVTARVYEGDLGRITSEATARITVEAFPDLQLTGTLRSREPVVSTETRTVGVVFAVSNPDGLLLPGMFARAEISAGPPESVLAVPDAAIQHGEGRDLVFLHVDPEHFAAREVALGRRDGAYWELLGGLDGGERVVTTGAHQLRSVLGL